MCAGGATGPSLVSLPLYSPPAAPPAHNIRYLDDSNYAGRDGMWCVGINAAGYDLDPTGTCAEGDRRRCWTQPTPDQLRFFHDQGVNCFRLPITWERLQTTLGSKTLDLVAGYASTVDFILNMGDYVIIDPHNNDEGLRYENRNANLRQFVDLWDAISNMWKARAHAVPACPRHHPVPSAH